MIRYGGSGYVDMAAQHRDAKACTLLTFQDINPDIPPSRDVQEMKMASCADVGHGWAKGVCTGIRGIKGATPSSAYTFHLMALIELKLKTTLAAQFVSNRMAAARYNHIHSNPHCSHPHSTCFAGVAHCSEQYPSMKDDNSAHHSEQTLLQLPHYKAWSKLRGKMSSAMW